MYIDTPVEYIDAYPGSLTHNLKCLDICIWMYTTTCTEMHLTYIDIYIYTHIHTYIHICVMCMSCIC